MASGLNAVVAGAVTFTSSTPDRTPTASRASGRADTAVSGLSPAKSSWAIHPEANTATELHPCTNLRASVSAIQHDPRCADTYLLMAMQLPMLPDNAPLLIELRFVNPHDREDAIQEAWVAHLEGRNPARAVATFAQRLRRHRQRTVVSDRSW